MVYSRIDVQTVPSAPHRSRHRWGTFVGTSKPCALQFEQLSEFHTSYIQLKKYKNVELTSGCGPLVLKHVYLRISKKSKNIGLSKVKVKQNHMYIYIYIIQLYSRYLRIASQIDQMALMDRPNQKEHYIQPLTANSMFLQMSHCSIRHETPPNPWTLKLSASRTFRLWSRSP